MSLDIGRSFTFFTQDERWVSKVLIGGLLVLAIFPLLFTLIGWLFVAAILSGYSVQLLRNVIAGQETPLPEWTNWGERMKDGFKALVVSLVYSLPTILVSLIFSLPAQVMTATNNGRPTGASTGLQCIGGCLNFFLGIAVALLTPIAIARYASSNDIGYALRFGEVFATLRANISTYGMVLLVSIGVGIVGLLLSLITCGIGFPFIILIASLVQYHLYGQAYLLTQGGQGSYGQQYSPARPF